MADIKITDLAAYTDPVSTDVLPIVDVGSDITKKVSIADLLENAGTGTAAAPSFSFDGANGTGIYQPGVNQIAIATGGTQRLVVNSSGAAEFAGLLKAATIRPLNPDSASAPGLAVYNEIDTGFYRPASDTIGISTGGVERARVNSTGLLVGGTLPSAANIELNSNGSTVFNGLTHQFGDQGAAGPQYLTVTSGGGGAAGRFGYGLRNRPFVLATTNNAANNYLCAGTGGSWLFRQNTDDWTNVGLEVAKIGNDGSAEFAGDVTLGAWDGTGGSGVGANLGSSGAVYVRRASGSNDTKTLFGGWNGTDQVAKIDATGGAQFASDVLIGGTLPSSPNISLNSTGSATFASSVTSSGRFKSTRVSGSTPCFTGELNGTATSEIYADGSAQFAGDITCTDNSKGLILKSPDGTSFRLSVANDGTLSASAA